MNTASNASSAFSLKAALSMAFVVFATACSPSADLSNFNKSSDNSGIINGKAVTQGSPLQRSVVLILNPKQQYICTGSLLPNNIVMTAAHCIGEVAADHLVIFALSMEPLLKDKELARQFARRVSATAVHDAWGKENADETAWTGDMALMKFEGSIPAGYAPAEFVPAFGVATNDWAKEGAMTTVAGYGVTKSEIIEVPIPKNPDADPEFLEKVEAGEYFCEIDEKAKKVSKCFMMEASGEGTLHTTDLPIAGRFNPNEVVLQQDKGTASCVGDSGGPAYIKSGDKYLLWGITSRGSHGCNNFVIYSDATSQMKWIQEKSAALAKAAPTTPAIPKPAPVPPTTGPAVPAPKPVPVTPAPAPKPVPVTPAPAPKPGPVTPAPAPKPNPVTPAPKPSPSPAPKPAPGFPKR